MDTRSIFRTTITGLSFCAVGLLGGWQGNHPASYTSSNRLHTYKSRIAEADTVVKKDSTWSIGGQTVVANAPVDNPEVPPSTPWNPAGWTGRIVVGEYITGLYCPPCRINELAFDAVIKRYPSTAFITLAYHGGGNLPIDNMTDSLWDRMNVWYGFNKYGKSVFPYKGGDDWIDGHSTYGGLQGLTSDHQIATKIYENMVTAIDAELHKAPEAVLHVQAVPKGGTVTAHVKVDSLTQSHSDVYVRIFVVEDTVHLTWNDTQARGAPRLTHYMVVRGVAHDAKHSVGLPMHGSGTISYTFDLAKAQQDRLRYRKMLLGQESAKTAEESADLEIMKQVFPIQGLGGMHNWTMDPTRFHVVAMVQDTHTGDVLQSQMIPVDGKLLKL